MTPHCSEFKSSPYIGFYKFSQPAIVVCEPDLIHDVLVRDFQYFNLNDNHASEIFDKLVAYNPFLAQKYTTWKRSRPGLVPVFTMSKVDFLHYLFVHLLRHRLIDFCLFA